MIMIIMIKSLLSVIATDGESTDGNLADAMKPLEELPVWVVIRLCTDEDSVVEYWNNIDSQLELDMDVLDDLNGRVDGWMYRWIDVWIYGWIDWFDEWI